MAKRGFLERHRIVRNAIREDILYFALPAILVFSAGLVVSARDGSVDLWVDIWDLVRHPRSLFLFSILNIVGLALFIVGLTTALVAQITLRRFYSSTLVIKEDHQLITHGIYRFARHPIYLGVIIAIIGIPVYASSLYGFLTMLVLIPIIHNRIRLEEELLTEEFQDAYQKFKKATKKLIPFIY